MTIQIPDVGTGYPADKTGDSPWLAMKKVQGNFADPTNAASKLLGTTTGRVPLAEDVNKLAHISTAGSSTITGNPDITSMADIPVGGSHYIGGSSRYLDAPQSFSYANYIRFEGYGASGFSILHGYGSQSPYLLYMRSRNTAEGWMKIYHDKNTTKDSNGMIKASSPVLRVFNAHIEGNEDGEKMDAKFIKNSVGNYLIKGTTGLADEGWYVTVPQDANGNNLVAVEYESLENGDVVLRTYKRKFDFETVSIVADHDNPLDIPDTRWIDLRFNEIPFEAQEELPTNGG